MQQKETRLLSYTIHKINLKWIKDLNIRPEDIKLLEVNIDGKLLDLGLGDDFLDLITKAKATKAKINKQKIFANHMSSKGLISKMYK